MFDEFEREEIVSERTYNLIIGGCLLWGFIINAIIVANVNVEPLITGGGYILFLIGYFISCFAGIALTRNDSPVVSFIGYNLVVIPFGLILAIVLACLNLPSSIVLTTVIVTGIITFVMMTLGAAFPNFFNSIGKYIGMALLITIIVEIIGVFFFPQIFAVTDVIVALIFSGYIGYDWGRAQSNVKTVDNAVDSACELYMDILNLFIRLLEIFGRSNRRSSR